MPSRDLHLAKIMKKNKAIIFVAGLTVCLEGCGKTDNADASPATENPAGRQSKPVVSAAQQTPPLAAVSPTNAAATAAVIPISELAATAPTPGEPAHHKVPEDSRPAPD